MNQPLEIDYYTDVLCIWAWIAQRRIEELQLQWGEQIQIQHHYLNLFGDTSTRIAKNWADRGGYSGFGAYVIESAAPYGQAPVNPEIWITTRPATSANAHLILKAAAQVSSASVAEQLALSIRHAFFVDAADIGNLGILMDIARSQGLNEKDVYSCIESGHAGAALMNDYLKAQQLNIQGSPSWVMNNGRQTLYGNVGYQLLNANVESLLSRNEEGASWC